MIEQNKKSPNHPSPRPNIELTVHIKAVALLKSLLPAQSQVLLATFQQHLVDVRQTASSRSNVKLQANFILE